MERYNRRRSRLPGAWIAMHGGRKWAGGMRRTMSQDAVSMVVRPPRAYERVVSARGRRQQMLRRRATGDERRTTTGVQRAQSGRRRGEGRGEGHVRV